MTKRVGVAGLLHESNTFSQVPTTRADFEQRSLAKGDALVERWAGGKHEISGLLEGAALSGLTVVPLMATFAMPSRAIEAATFDELADEMVDAIRAATPLDGILLALHGAAVAENYPDADGEIARRIRQAVGPDVPIIMTLDLHANISRKMVENTNATVVYRSNPHLDQKQRGIEAAILMARTLAGEVRPVQALEMPPLLINIARQYTGEQPARSLYEDLEQAVKRPAILSASVAMGFYFSDVEEAGASFLAVADGDVAAARDAAQWMAMRAWDRRAEFAPALPGPDEAVRRTAALPNGPVVLMDIGDNVGGGSPGDSTLLFHSVLRQGVPNALVILYDPEAVRACVAAGVRQEIELEVGAKTDKLHGEPVRVRGKVKLISDGLFVERQVRHGGWGAGDQGVTVVLETAEQHTIVLTSLRMPPMSLEQILSLGIKPESKKVLIVKGVVAPRAAYEPVASEVMLVDTAGSTSANPANFEYHRRRRPLYPLEMEASYSPRS